MRTKYASKFRKINWVLSDAPVKKFLLIYRVTLWVCAL